MSSKAIAKTVRAATKKNIKQSTQPGPIYSRILHELYLRAFGTTPPIVMSHYKSDPSIMFISSRAFMQDAQTAAKVGLTDPFPITAARAIVALLENIHTAIVREGIDGETYALIVGLRPPSMPVLARGESDVDDDHKHAIKTLLGATLKSPQSTQMRDVAGGILNMIKLIVEQLLHCMLICKRVPSKGFLAGVCFAAGFPDKLIDFAEIPAPKKKSRSKAKTASADDDDKPAPKAATKTAAAAEKSESDSECDKNGADTDADADADQ